MTQVPPSGTKVMLSDTYLVDESTHIQRVSMVNRKTDAMLFTNKRGQKVLIDWSTFLVLAEIAQDYLQEIYDEKDHASKH